MSAGSLRPLGVAELLDTAARLVRDSVRASVVITLPVVVVRTVLVSLVAYSALGTVSGSAGSASDAATRGGRVALPELLLELFIGSLAAVASSGLLAPLYLDAMRGRRLTARQAMGRVGRSALPLLGLVVVAAIGLEIGIVLLVVGGVWLWGVWALAGPALVTERLGPIAALRRSFDLARVGFWRVWGIRALGWVVTTALGVFVTVPFELLASWVTDDDPFDSGDLIGSPGLYVTITALGSLVVGLILSPFAAAVDVVLYLDARVRREGLDIAIALDDSTNHPRSAPGTAKSPTPSPSSSPSPW